MRIFLRIALFILTFLFGVQFVAFMSSVSHWPAVPDIDLPTEYPAFEIGKATKPRGITVAFAGMEPESKDEAAYLKFVIYNGTLHQVTYGAKGGAERPFPDVWVNGRPLPEEYRCGSGMMLYEIAPGMSAEFRIGRYEFENVPKKGDLINVGFYLRESHAEFGEAIFSEPFMLPEKFRRTIDQWNKMR